MPMSGFSRGKVVLPQSRSSVVLQMQKKTDTEFSITEMKGTQGGFTGHKAVQLLQLTH